jgi:hypothetical protein
LELEPWLEEAYQQLMRLLALDSQRSAALAQFQACRRILSDELGVEPSAETIHLYESIRDGGLGTAQNTWQLEFDPPLRSLIIAGRGNEDKTGVTFKLIEDFLERGKKAVDHSSYEEAVANYRHGLDLLRSLPDSPAKLECELELQIALGAALLPIRIWSHPEVARAYQRAYQFCHSSEPVRVFPRFESIGQLLIRCAVIGFVGSEIGQWLLEVAEEQQDMSASLHIIIAESPYCSRESSTLTGNMQTKYLHCMMKTGTGISPRSWAMTLKWRYCRNRSGCGHWDILTRRLSACARPWIGPRKSGTRSHSAMLVLCLLTFTCCGVKYLAY